MIVISLQVIHSRSWGRDGSRWRFHVNMNFKQWLIAARNPSWQLTDGVSK